MSRRELLSEEEMAALLNDEAFSEEEFEEFAQELFSPSDFADFSELVAPLLFAPFSRLAPLIDSTIELVTPELALRGSDSVASFGSDLVLIPISFFTTGSRRQPDSLIVINSSLASKIAVLMIGGTLDASSTTVDKSQLSTVTEFFRQFRLLLGRTNDGTFIPKASIDKSPWLKALVPVNGDESKIIEMIFRNEDHIVELSGAAQLNEYPPFKVSFFFPVELSKKLLERARTAGFNCQAELHERDEAESSAPGTGMKGFKSVTRETIALDPSAVMNTIEERTKALDRLSASAASVAESLAPLSSNGKDHSTRTSPGTIKEDGSGLTYGGTQPHRNAPSSVVDACLGHATLSAEDLLRLRAGDIVKLDNPAAEDVDLIVDGKVIGRGEVVVERDHYAVKIRSLASKGSSSNLHRRKV